MFIKKLEQIIKVGSLLCLFLAASPWAAAVAPLYFDGVAEADQQDYWDALMKYKLWGTHGIDLPNRNVHIAEESGYTGTAEGDFKVGNPDHTLGGPILVGGNFILSNGPQNNKFLGGPTRILGSVTLPNWEWHNGIPDGASMEGPYCIKGNVSTISNISGDTSPEKWLTAISGGAYASETVVLAGADDLYGNCPATVPQVDTHLKVPLMPAYTGTWSPAINLTDGVDQTTYIHVPPILTGDPETADLYIDQITLANSANKILYVLMPPGGRLTRIFLQNGLNIDKSANSTNISVMYVDDDATWNGTQWAYDPTKVTTISNDNYAGNLMFYTSKKIFIDYLINGNLQGSYITSDSLVISGHMKFAGQLIADNLELTNDITGDFRYVPFDPPILNFDPTASSGGVFSELSVDQLIDVTLDTLPKTNVSFDYCFDVDTTATPSFGVASASDFGNLVSDGTPLPICGRDTSSVLILAGQLRPDSAHAVYFNPIIDGNTEPIETLYMRIFNLSGAVLPGNRKTGSFTLTIADNDFNPIVRDTSITGYEDDTLQFDSTYFPFSSTDPDPDILHSIVITSLPSEGSLFLDNVLVIKDQVIPKDSLSYLTFIGALDSSGSPYTTFTFKAVTKWGESHLSATITVNLLPVNDAPQMGDSVVFTIAENSPIGTVVGDVVAVDADNGSVFTYSLITGGDGDAVFNVASDGRVTVKLAQLNYEVKKRYTLIVQATDNGLNGVGPFLSDTTTVAIYITDVNEAPVVSDASWSFAENNEDGFEIGTVVVTDEDVSSTHTYSILGGSSFFVINALGTISTASGVIFDYETMDKIYTLKVIVTDNGLNGVGPTLADTATVTITLLDVNESPVMANQSFTVLENSAAATLVGNIVASDPENGVLTYTILSGNEANRFVMDALGKITVRASNTLDYEDVNQYTLVVEVSDDGLDVSANALKTTATITINIQNVNEAPVVSDASWSFAENNEDGFEIGTVVVTDEDVSSTHTYSILGGSSFFVINSSGAISTAPGVIFDFETMDETYTLKVIVTDNGLNGVGPTLADTATVTITLLNVNDPPVMANQSFTVLENSAAATLVGNIVASDPENGVLTYTILSGNEANRFVMDALGKITVRASNTLDYEDVNQYTLVVEVSDDGLDVSANALKTTATITINVQNVNEAPVVSDASWTLAENNVDGFEIGTVVVTDEDALSTHTYSLSGTGSTLFVINASGTISTAPSVIFDYETMAHTYNLTVTVRDNGLNGVGPFLEGTASVIITLLDRNDPPVIANQSFDVFENSDANTLVGNIVAIDPEGGSLDYTILSGNEANLFVVNSSGQITVRASNTLDYDTMDTLYVFRVVVSDDGLGNSVDILRDTALVTIRLKNVNEAPVWNEATLEVSENQPVSTIVGTVSATDEDLYESLTYTIVGGTGIDVFNINPSTGVITTKAVFDYETKNSYTLDIEVNDDEFTIPKTFVVNILNVNESPEIDDTNTNIDENVPIGTVVTVVTAVDVDSPELTYDIIRDDDGKKFNISTTGTITVAGELDYEKQNIYRVKVVVSDGVSSDTATVTVRINNLNEAPTVNDAKFYVAENATSSVKIGTVTYSDPEKDVVTFMMLQDTSGLFRITGFGDIYLKAGASLDYESIKNYVIKVKGSDPQGLSDSANIEIVVTNVIEKAVVKIVTVITKDSIFPNPETIYINTTKVNIEWTEDGKRQFGDTILVEGLNRIIKEYCVEYKDECGLDTVDIYVNTQTPGVSLVPKGYDQSKVSGVTIVEQKESKDTSFYVNRNENRIVVTIADPGTNGQDVITEFELTADLKTVNIPSSTFEKLNEVTKNWSFETDKDLSYSTVNKEEKVSYQTKVNGNAITVSYDLHKDSTTALISYVTTINGQKVTISYVVDRLSGDLINNPSTGAVYSVGYTYVDEAKNEIFVSYSVDSKGKIVKDPKDDSILYQLSYSYTNVYGNTAIKTIDIVLDKTPPAVQIISPLSGVTVSSVSLDVRWTVDGVVQDTLTLQSLEKGMNVIIRAYRDKAGNETADTVVIMMKNAKDIVISMQEPLVEMTKERIEEFNRVNPPAKDDRFGVSLLNVRTNTEEEVIVGTASGTKKGTGKEPYPSLSGSHLGPTLEIDVKLPSLTSFGGLASLSDLIESDGLIAIEAGGGWDRKKVTVDQYVSQYCTEEFKGKFDSSDPSATPLYKTQFGMNIWIYSSLGNFLDQYKFSPDLNSRDYVNAAGVAKMYFELKPDASGYLRDKRGRLLGTGAYLYKTEIKMTYVLQCTLPDQTPKGTKKVVKEDLLSTFGYKRPEKD